jgi:hypothetical protein
MISGKIPNKIYYSDGYYIINPTYYGLPASLGAVKDFGESPGKMPAYAGSPGKNRKFEHDNTKPVSKPKLIGFALSFGGTKIQERGVFVVESNGQFFPMELEVFYETLKNAGPIKEGNILPGDYVFAMANRIVRLVRVGSELHNILIESTKLLNKPRVAKKELEIGSVYSTAAGRQGIFLGYATTIEYLPDSSGLDSRGNVFDIDKIEHDKLLLWMEVWQEGKNNKHFQVYYNRSIEEIWDLKLVKTHNYVSKLKYKIDVDRDVINRVSQACYNKVRKRITDAVHLNKNGRVFYNAIGEKKVPKYCYGSWKDSKYYNMSLFGCHPSFGERKDLLELAKFK